MVCTEHMACIKFMPCGHVIACYDCCQKMKRCLHCKAAIENKTWSGKQAITMKEKAKIQWNLCNPTKIYGINVFLVTEIKPEYFDILYNQTHFPGPLVCRIRQVPLYIDFVKFSNLFLVGLLNLLTLSTNYLSEYNE